MAGTRNSVGEVGSNRQDKKPDWISTLDHLEGQQIGRYLIRHRLGGGGVATVYQAYDDVMGRTVALKLLPPNPDDATLNRFRREALMAGALRHPHIVRIFQVGTSARGGAAYLAMELVEGESLASLLARQGAMQPAESCNLLEPIARALAFAHSHGIVHRDVKPGNILLRPVSPGTAHSVQLETLDHPVIPLLSDFGVARFLDAPELTSTGRTVGTPAFMAPEQCMGSREIDGRADVYALGTVLFRCVTGRLPFSGSMTQVLHAQVYEPVVIEDYLLPRLGAVAEILRRSLAKDPDARYAGAAQMADELAHAAQRTRGARPQAQPSESATATLTLASVEALPQQGMSVPVTVLVEGASARSEAAVSSPRARRSGGRDTSPWGRWAGMAVALVLVAAVSLLAGEAVRRRGGPRATPTTAQLAVMAATPTMDGSSQAANPDAPSPPQAQITAAADDGLPTDDARIENTPATGDSVTSVAVGGVEGSTATPVAQGDTPTPTLPPPTQPAVEPPPEPPPALPTPTAIAPTSEPQAGQGLTLTQGLTPALGVTQEEAVAGVCANVIDEYFMGTLAQIEPSLREQFHCPNAPAYVTTGSYLDFAQGFMLVLDESPYVYVYYQATGEWEQVVRRDDGEPDTNSDPAGLPPPFAQVWNESQRRIALGPPTTTAPVPVDGIVQVFTGGMLVGDRSRGAIYAFPLSRLRL